MIYGKLTLQDWHNVHVMGEVPESSFESPDLRIFFYGTIYNRDLLPISPDDSNAKIVAELYLEDSELGFSRLDGSFTIVYYSKDYCGIVRDHHGTHSPVYYTSDGDFATSWQHLQESAGVPFGYHPISLSSFLQRGIMDKEHFAVSGICSLHAGEYLKMDCRGSLYGGQLIKHIPKIIIENNSDPESYARRYGELHGQAIRRRIGGSQRVGILLSGGYDSGSNLAALRSIYDGKIESYSVGFKGDTWTELPMARLMSETFDTCHHEYEIDGSEINALPDIVRFLGEPFVEGGLMVNYCAMRMIGDDKPEIILGGDGSDQYFGTSGREVALHYLAGRAGIRPLMRGMNYLLSHEAFNTGGKLSRINFHLDKILHILEGERFGFSDSALQRFLQHPEYDFAVSKPPKPDIRSFNHLYTQHALISDLEIVINRIILFKASRMAQMFDNNLSFPFMDLELFNFLQELPVGLKCKGDSVLDIARGHSISKYLLKYYYKPLLPEAITSKKKQGGFAPMPLFFRDSAQRARLKEFILSSTIFDNYLCRDTVERFLVNYDHESTRIDTWFWYRQNKALQYFNLLTLVTWWEEFVEKRKVQY